MSETDEPTQAETTQSSFSVGDSSWEPESDTEEDAIQKIEEELDLSGSSIQLDMIREEQEEQTGSIQMDLLREVGDLSEMSEAQIKAAVSADMAWFTEILTALSAVGNDLRIMFDGGTFDHMFGKNVQDRVINVVQVPAKYVRTASSIIKLDKKGDLPHKYGVFRSGYLNPYLDTTLISEGKLVDEENWEFQSSRKGKKVTVRDGDISVAEF